MDKGQQFYQQALALMRQAEPDVDGARHCLDEALRAGSPEAAYALGTWYLHRAYVEKDVQKGTELIERAARADVAAACYDMAVSYEQGMGVEKTLTRSFEFYVKAMLRGDKQSIYEVGRCLYYGIGIYGIGMPRDERVGSIFVGAARRMGIGDN